MTDMTVMRADSGQARVVASLLEAFNTEFETPSPPLEALQRRFAAMLERDDVFVLLAGSPELPTGFALVTLRPTPYYDSPLAVLDELYVVPDRRDRGLGTELLQAMFDELRSRGCGEVHINVDEQDIDTRRFYERHGFSNLQDGTDERMLCYVQEL